MEELHRIVFSICSRRISIDRAIIDLNIERYAYLVVYTEEMIEWPKPILHDIGSGHENKRGNGLTTILNVITSEILCVLCI